MRTLYPASRSPAAGDDLRTRIVDLPVCNFFPEIFSMEILLFFEGVFGEIFRVQNVVFLMVDLWWICGEVLESGGKRPQIDRRRFSTFLKFILVGPSTRTEK